MLNILKNNYWKINIVSMIFQILFEANILAIQDLKITLLNYYLKIENNYIDSFTKKIQINENLNECL